VSFVPFVVNKTFHRRGRGGRREEAMAADSAEAAMSHKTAGGWIFWMARPSWP
jgi:hypothetical protein